MATDTAIEQRRCDVVRAADAHDDRVYRPSVDIIEKRDEWLLLADMPGATPDAIDIQFESGTLSIHATVPSRDRDDRTGWLACEYGVGDYAREFRIGEGIDADAIKAEFKDGVLAVHLPKSAAVLPKKVSVKAE